MIFQNNNFIIVDECNFFIKAGNSGNEIITLENLAEFSLTEDFYI